MKRLAALLIVCGGLSTLALGCASGEVDADLQLYLESGNLDYYEEVLFPTSSRSTYDDIFAGVPLYLPFHITYDTTRVDAIITQRGDLQITSHLTAGQVFRDSFDSANYDYLNDDEWNGESSTDNHGEQLYEELTAGASEYNGLDEDLRLILLANLPATDGDELWSSDGWDYPAELVANYQETYVDDEDQEFPIPEDDIQLMARMLIGGELFETVPGLRLDAATGACEETTEPNLVIESLTMPQEQGRLGHVTGHFELYMEAASFRANSGIAVLSGEFDADIHVDRWAMQDIEEQQDLEP